MYLLPVAQNNFQYNKIKIEVVMSRKLFLDPSPCQLNYQDL